MSTIFEAVKTCVIQCANSTSPYQEIEAFCKELRSEGWPPSDVEVVQREAHKAIIDMRRQRLLATQRGQASNGG